MNLRDAALGVCLFVTGISCSGGQSPAPAAPSVSAGRMSRERAAAMNAHHAEMMAEVPAASEDAFAQLEVGADYATSMTRMNREPFRSPTHGHRWVNVFVNAVGLRAYQNNQDLPVGSVVVKESFEDANGHADLTRRGPIFVMERRAAGYAPDRGDYWYALHWALPVGPNARLANGQPLPPLYWRGRSGRVQYCEDCHSAYDPNRMGGVPRELQTWGADAGAR